MRVGIYGGSFNPIHLGHLHVADCAARDMMLDTVLFVPAFDPYTKDQTNLASYVDRCLMTSIAIKNDIRFKFMNDPSRDLRESDPGRHSYTIDVVREVKKQIKQKRRGTNNKIFLILGEDSFQTFTKWFEYQEILDNIDGIYVVPRGRDTTPEYIAKYFSGTNVVFSTHGTLKLSSTEIRNYLSKREPCRYLLPSNVYRYIDEKGLYETED